MGATFFDILRNKKQLSCNKKQSLCNRKQSLRNKKQFPWNKKQLSLIWVVNKKQSRQRNNCFLLQMRGALVLKSYFRP